MLEAMNHPRFAIIALVVIGLLLAGVAWQRYQKCLSLGGDQCRIVGPKPRTIIKNVHDLDSFR